VITNFGGLYAGHYGQGAPRRSNLQHARNQFRQPPRKTSL